MSEQPMLTKPTLALSNDEAQLLAMKYINHFRSSEMNTRIEGLMAFAADVANVVAEKQKDLLEAAEAVFNSVMERYGKDRRDHSETTGLFVEWGYLLKLEAAIAAVNGQQAEQEVGS